MHSRCGWHGIYLKE